MRSLGGREGRGDQATLQEGESSAKCGEKDAVAEAIIIADATTPYRLLVEVMFTLGQNQFGTYHLMVMQAKD